MSGAPMLKRDHVEAPADPGDADEMGVGKRPRGEDSGAMEAEPDEGYDFQAAGADSAADAAAAADVYSAMAAAAAAAAAAEAGPKAAPIGRPIEDVRVRVPSPPRAMQSDHHQQGALTQDSTGAPIGANIGPMGRPREKNELPEWRQKALAMDKKKAGVVGPRKYCPPVRW